MDAGFRSQAAPAFLHESNMASNTTTATNRYGALAAEIYDIDKPFFTLPYTRFHLERF